MAAKVRNESGSNCATEGSDLKTLATAMAMAWRPQSRLPRRCFWQLSNRIVIFFPADSPVRWALKRLVSWSSSWPRLHRSRRIGLPAWEAASDQEPRLSGQTHNKFYHFRCYTSQSLNFRFRALTSSSVLALKDLKSPFKWLNNRNSNISSLNNVDPVVTVGASLA